MSIEVDYEEQGGLADQRDVERLKADLFGIDDEDDEGALDAEPLVDEDVDELARRAQDSDDDVGAKRKRLAVDSDDEVGGNEQKRLKHHDVAEDEPELDDQDEEPLEDHHAPREDDEAAAERPEEDEDGELAADAAFIDDTGVAPEDQYVDDEGEEEEGLPIPEAEEAEEGEEDEIDTMLKSKRRQKRQEDAGTVEREMCTFLAKMDLAAEADVKAHREKKPAMNKLMLLREVEDMMAKVTYHDEFLRQGGLGSFKGWLQYYEDGTLPNLRVRTTLLRILDKLPINTMYEEHKQWLAKSMVGQLVMFFMKCRDEVQENQRLAKQLVEKWSKPIFEAAQADHKQHDPQEVEERLEIRRIRKQAERQVEAVHEQDLARAKAIPRGQPGFRWHASIPQAAKLDYVKQPESLTQPVERVERTGKKESSRFDKKIREISRKKNASGLKAQSVSVQGRGLYMMK